MSEKDEKLGQLDIEGEDAEEAQSPTHESDEGDLVINSSNKKVLMEPKDITIFQYKRWFDQGRLNLNPDWQRASCIPSFSDDAEGLREGLVLA